MKRKEHSSLFWLSMFLLFIPGLLHAYLLMPFPGSQNLEAIKLCYYLEKFILPLRIIGGFLLLWFFYRYFSTNTRNGKIVKVFVLVLALGSLYITDIAYKASSMFEEPKTVRFANSVNNKVPESYIVLGVVDHGVAKAYPLVYLGYHHKVQDQVGELPVLVTYCTMCRTGRVYSPVVNGVRQNFRLVGARHYNAIIEDQSTGSWWYQATGEAAVGPLKGSFLKEIPYEQSSLSAWLDKHPGSLILQPDGHFKSDYDDLKNYDVKQPVDQDSTIKNKDTLFRKTWVIGVIAGKQPKAYDWRKIQELCLLNDKIGSTPVLIGLEDDDHTFHAFSRELDGKQLNFKADTSGHLIDQETASVWNWEGLCISGAEKGKQLSKIQAYQEYWHSWQHFHPATTYWKK